MIRLVSVLDYALLGAGSSVTRVAWRFCHVSLRAYVLHPCPWLRPSSSALMCVDRIAKTENDDSDDPVEYVVDVSFAVD